MRPAERIAGFLVHHHRLVLGFFLLLTLVFALFLPRFSIDASAETLLTKDNVLYQQAQRTREQFDPEEFILVAYKPLEGSIYGPQALQDLGELSAQFAELERVEKVQSILNVPLINRTTVLGPDFDPAALTLANSQFSEPELREIFNEHPVFTDLLVNSDQTATALQIVFRQDAARTEEEMRQVRSDEIAAIYEAIAPYRDRADIHLGGTQVLAEHLIEIIRNDLVVFGTAIAALITLLLFILFRDWRWVLLPLLCCGCSVVITMGFFAVMGWKTTVISANFIALQLILTLALVIHLIVHYQALARDGQQDDHRQLLAATIRDKLQPSLYAGITTSVGFASLLFSGIQPVISFGWMMIVAMATSIAVSLALFPGFLMLCRQVLPHRPSRFAAGVVEVARSVVGKRPGLIILGSLALFGFSIAGLFRLELENSFLNYFSKDTRVYQELMFIDRELGGSTPLDIVYTPQAAHPEGLRFGADTLQLLQRVQEGLEGSPAVGKVMSVVNFTQLARAINADKPLTEYELNTLYILLDRNLRENLLGSYVDTDSGAFRISVRMQDSTEGLNRGRFLESLQGALAGLEPGNGTFLVTNLFVLYQDILQQLYESQVLTLALVYVVLGLLLMVLFRSVITGLVALVPNILVTLFVLGFMGWAGIPLDLMTITIAAIAMGIAVDDTIHFVHQFREAGDAGTDEALRQAFRKVGLAMLYTSTVVALGFSVLGFSDFVPGVFFGLLTALAMLVALLVDLSLLPVLLKKTSSNQRILAK